MNILDELDARERDATLGRLALLTLLRVARASLAFQTALAQDSDQYCEGIFGHVSAARAEFDAALAALEAMP